LPVDFKTRDFFYPIGILRLRRFFERSQWLPLEELKAYQEERLLRVIDHAYYHVPYYRRLLDERHLHPRDLRKLEDLSELPFLTREDVRSNFDVLCADNAKRFRPAQEFTTGSTGTPLTFLVDRPSNILEFVYYWRHWSWGGFHLGDPFVQLRWECFHRRPNMTEKLWQYQPRFRRLLLNSVRISRERIGEYARALRKFQPRFIHGRPSNLYCLALFLREQRLDDIPFKAAFTGGEVVLPEHREMIEKTFGCKVLDHYGHMERCMAVTQCPEGSYHINLEYGILQLTEEKKLRHGATLGRVVCTSLHKMAMPFLRYKIEDILELYPEEKRCPCGRTLPLVKMIHGRVRPIIMTPDGRPVTTLAAGVMNVKGIRAFQFIHEAPGQLVTRIVKGKEYTPGTEETVKLGLRKLIGEGMRIDLEYVSEEELERDTWGNVQMIISHVRAS
jgi:phenylacetate-CoA ligase